MAIDTIKATAILDGAVDTDDLADGAVTTAKITDGHVTASKLHADAVTPAAVSDTDNTSTGLFTLPAGTTAQRPGTAYTGAQRYNTDLSVMEYYNGTDWLKIAAQVAVLDSVTGTIYAGLESTLTLSGSGFLTDSITVNFTQSSDSIDEDVVVTATSDTAATVTVPAAVYNNVTAGNIVTIIVTNSDQSTSDGVNKTAASIPSGGTVTTSGDYRIHTFTSSGTFTNTTASLPVEYLVIAGGGGGGRASEGANAPGGGGGAGGYRTNVSGQTSGRNTSAEAAMTLSATSYSVTVGAGGAGAAVDNTPGNSGSNSVFNGITSLGGGRGGGNSGDVAASSGGSGGGGMESDGAGGSGTAGQGFDGSNGSESNDSGGCGGGAGGNGSGDLNGTGGAGLSSNITGSSVTRAGGGSGKNGTGGSGGGGGEGVDGTVNTGGGGGADESVAGTGGSGIVIIRYDINDL